MLERLVLGTAQLGMPYGISNKTGQPDQAMSTAIIRKAWECGIQEFDTAQGYGVSEAFLGKAFSDLGISNEVRVVSKFNPDLDHLNPLRMSLALDESLKRLGLSYLFGIMLHREELLSLWNKGLSKILYSFVFSGKVKYLGVSVYSPAKAIEALETEGIDFVQLPTNILDRRFEEAGVFELAYKKNKKVYIRSVFLQGLILLPLKEIPDEAAQARPIIKQLELWCRSFGVTRQEVALGFVKSEMPHSKIIFGADVPWHVEQNAELWKRDFSSALIELLKKNFKNVNEKILMPNLWS